MAFLDWITGKQGRPEADSDVETIRRIAEQLEQIEGDGARFVACFAYVLGRVAHADLDISDDEMLAMETLVAEHAGLAPAQAALAVRIASQRNELFGSTDNFLVTRTFAELASLEEKRAMLDCLYAVSAADGSISAEEDHEIRRIASELMLDHQEFINARARYAEFLTLLND